MATRRLKLAQKGLINPILIKKKENLLYLTGRSFMHGYLLVKPMNTDKKRMNTDIKFLGDGLEKMEGMKSDFLKNVGKYVSPRETLEVFSDFTYGEVKYIKSKFSAKGGSASGGKNPKLKLKVVIK